MVKDQNLLLTRRFDELKFEVVISGQGKYFVTEEF
jgi:hypothetical protein